MLNRSHLNQCLTEKKKERAVNATTTHFTWMQSSHKFVITSTFECTSLRMRWGLRARLSQASIPVYLRPVAFMPIVIDCQPRRLTIESDVIFTFHIKTTSNFLLPKINMREREKERFTQGHKCLQGWVSWASPSNSIPIVELSLQHSKCPPTSCVPHKSRLICHHLKSNQGKKKMQ